MSQAPRGPAQRLPIPPLIKRNIALFALSQSFTGAGMQFAYGLGPLMVMSLTGSMMLAGTSVALIGLSRFLVAYPIGQVTDWYGRKPGILLGLIIALCGALALFAAMTWRSPFGLLLGLLTFGMGMNAAQQLRVAATDMFPPNRRAEALGYVALGALAGLIISPVVVTAAEATAHSTHQDPLALPWLLLPVLIVPGMALVGFVRPDPRDIGMRLEAYYPGYVPPTRVLSDPTPFRAFDLLHRPATRVAILANSAAQGNMSVMMVLTSLMLSHHGHSLAAIAWSHLFHTIGMFAFTIPLGRMADRIGRRRVMAPGLAVAVLGAALVAFTGSFWTITLGTFLVGLGWAAANVAATALIADEAQTTERGRAIGFSETCAGATSVVLALLTGPLAEAYGLPVAGWLAILMAVPPLVLAWSVGAANAGGRS